MISLDVPYLICIKNKKKRTIVKYTLHISNRTHQMLRSPLWPVLYHLCADLVQAKISLGCGADLKVPPTVETHLRPPRG